MQQRRIGRARADAIYIDAVAGDLPRQRLGEGDGAALGAGINGLAQAADATRVAGDDDDLAAAALDHLVEEGVRDRHRAEQVQVDHLAPEFRRVFHEGLDLAPAGDIGDHIHMAAQFVGPLLEGGDRLQVGDVEADELGAVPLLAQGGGGLAPLLFVAQQHEGAGRRQRLGRGPPDARCGAGDDRRLVFQLHAAHTSRFRGPYRPDGERNNPADPPA